MKNEEEPSPVVLTRSLHTASCAIVTVYYLLYRITYIYIVADRNQPAKIPVKAACAQSGSGGGSPGLCP